METHSLNINPDTLKLFLIICFSLIGTLTLIIGFLIKYLLKKKDDNSTEQINDFKEVVEAVSDTVKEQSRNVDVLGSAIEGLKGVVKIVQTQQKAFEKLMDEKNQTNIKRLDSHADDIKRIDKKIIEIDTRCKIKFKEIGS